MILYSYFERLAKNGRETKREFKVGRGSLAENENKL